MLVRDGIIVATGRSEVIAKQLPAGAEVVNADGRVVLPGFVDAHAHPVFAGDRVNEFEMRARGASYEEIAAGGGGIPVYYDENNDLRTLDAVIDKDLASAFLASKIKASHFYILTDVSFIYKDFGKPTQEKLEFLNYADTLKYLNDGTFGEGTMAPKIKACLHFIENGGEKSVITEAKKLEDKSYGSKITMQYDKE